MADALAKGAKCVVGSKCGWRAPKNKRVCELQNERKQNYWFVCGKRLALGVILFAPTAGLPTQPHNSTIRKALESRPRALFLRLRLRPENRTVTRLCRSRWLPHGWARLPHGTGGFHTHGLASAISRMKDTSCDERTLRWPRRTRPAQEASGSFLHLAMFVFVIE